MMSRAMAEQGAEQTSCPLRAARCSGLWVTLNTLLVGAFIAALLVWPIGYMVFSLALAFVALTAVCIAPWRYRVRLDVEDALWLSALGLFAGVWCADVLRTGEWPHSLSGDGYWLPLWPVLAAGLLVWLRMQPPRLRGWLLGLAVGAPGAASIAMYERAWLGLARTNNAINAIPFGNLALLLGLLALVALLGRLDSSRFKATWLTAVLALAAGGGLMASLLSGTRGGWVALPLLCWLIYRTYRRVLPQRPLRWTMGLLGILLVLGVSLPQTGVAERVSMAVDNLRGYVVDDARNTSLGLRLEMWRAGVSLFVERPLLGWGEGHLQAARDARVASGELSRGVSEYDQLHSDLIDTAARRGVLGLISLLALYGVPLLLFVRHLRGASGSRERTLALSGLVICIAFIDFGLSQSMLRDARGLSGYLLLGVSCWALLKVSVSRSAEGSRRSHADCRA